jgi:hypothetical protein
MNEVNKEFVENYVKMNQLYKQHFEDMQRMNQQWLNLFWRPLMRQQEQYQEQKREKKNEVKIIINTARQNRSDCQ